MVEPDGNRTDDLFNAIEAQGFVRLYHDVSVCVHSPLPTGLLRQHGTSDHLHGGLIASQRRWNLYGTFERPKCPSALPPAERYRRLRSGVLTPEALFELERRCSPSSAAASSTPNGTMTVTVDSRQRRKKSSFEPWRRTRPRWRPAEKVDNASATDRGGNTSRSREDGRKRPRVAANEGYGTLGFGDRRCRLL